MKYIIGFLTVAILAVGCKGIMGSPTSTVTAFLETAKKGDIDGLKKYVTKQDVSLLELAEAGASIAKSFGGNVDVKEEMRKAFTEKTKDATYEVKGEKIDGDKAEVTVEVKQNGEVSSHPFKLQKEDGAWKISLTSTGLSEGVGSHGMNETDPNVNISDSIGKAMDQLKSMNTDSLANKMKQGMDKLKELQKNPEAAKQFQDAMEKLKEAAEKAKQQ